MPGARAIEPVLLAVAGVIFLAVGLPAEQGGSLIDAARGQDWGALRTLLLQKRSDVNGRQPDGATALHWAVHWDDDASVELLLGAGADADAANELGATPLYLACVNGSGATVERLLKAGANPNLPVSVVTAETPLMTAARAGSLEAVKALLAHGAAVNARDKTHNQSALMWAASQGHSAVVQALIEGGADIHGRSRVERTLVMLAGDEPAEIDLGGFTPLLFSARRGDVASAKALLAAGADINQVTPDKTSVLVVSAHSGHGALTEYLLGAGANPNADGSGYTALHAAVLRGDGGMVEALLRRKADVNATVRQGTQFNRASRDYALSVQWVGATPFWLAAAFAELDIMRALADAGADLYQSLPDGTTALMAATGLGFRGLREDRRGRRREPGELMVALNTGADERQARDAVQFQLARGADVNAANAAGDTAIHAAVSRKEASVVQLLFDHGARINVRNKRGQTPLSIAMTFTRTESNEGGVDTRMVMLLRKLGALD